MLHLQIGAWFAKQTLAFWLRIVALVVVLAIFITPSCMYVGVKKDLEEANSIIDGYKAVAKEADKKEKEVLPKIVYKDKVIDRVVTKTKIKREYIYVNNKEAADWACTFVPDAVIGLSWETSEAGGPGATKARALPEYCVLQADPGQTADK
jgi:hypothetical protein